MYFAEEEPRGGGGGDHGQDLSVGNLLPKGLCTGEAFSWPSKLMQNWLDFRRDFVTLFIMHLLHVCYVGNTVLIHW